MSKNSLNIAEKRRKDEEKKREKEEEEEEEEERKGRRRGEREGSGRVWGGRERMKGEEEGGCPIRYQNIQQIHK